MLRLIAGLFAGAMLATAAPPSVLAIRNARLVTVSGPVIPKGTVVVRNGLIEAAGADIPVPAEAWVIDGEGMTVYPGLTDGLSTWGITDETALAPVAAAGPIRGTGAPRTAVTANVNPATVPPPARGPEDRPATTSWLRAADLVKPSDRRLEAARSAGFTSSVTFPTRGIFAGQGAVINLAGDRGGKMVVSPSVGQYVATTTMGFSNYPGSLMGVMAYIRQVYLDAEHYKLAKEMYARKSAMARPEYDRALEGVLESPRVLLPAVRVVDIERMIRFAAELKLKPVLYGVPTGYKAAEAIAKSGVPVLVSLKWPERPRDADPEAPEDLKTLQLREEAPTTARALAAAKAKFAFYSDGIERPADVLRAVKRAIDAGLPAADAVRAMTLSPAEIFGLADRMGSIEKGKMANLVVTKGDLFMDGTKIQFVLIDGNKYEPITETSNTDIPAISQEAR